MRAKEPTPPSTPPHLMTTLSGIDDVTCIFVGSLVENNMGSISPNFCPTFFREKDEKLFWGKWRLAKGAQIWQIWLKFQILNLNAKFFLPNSV